MNKDYSSSKHNLQQQILEFCEQIASSTQIVAISLLGNYPIGTSSVKATSEVMLVIRDFQPRLISYVKIINGRSIIFFAADQWVFERDVDRGFLGEALAGALLFPYKNLMGKKYLSKQETLLKKRLVLEQLENLVSSFSELSQQLHIKPKYFMYEAMLNRVRVFPPLAYGLSSFINGSASKEEVENVCLGYMKALRELEKEGKINFSNGYVMVSKEFITESKKTKVRLANISKNAPRTLFTSVLSTLPQLFNFFSKNTEVLMKLKKFAVKKELDMTRQFVDPQKYVFAPTAKGLISLADQLDIESYAQKMLLKSNKGKITFNPIGGVLNDVYSINVHSDNTEKKVIVKRFKDWSGFKWFPLSIWSFGARNFAVLGRTRLEKEVSIGEFLRGKGITVPKILHVSHSKRLVFMEFIDGENLDKSIKRIAKAKDGENQEDLERIEKAGEIFAKVHAFHVTLGDTKPENVLFNSDNNPYLLDFEQASYDGDRAWDVAVFLYYAGHYLQPLNSNGKAELITKAFVKGYLKGGGEFSTIKKAGNSKYTRIFSVFTMPSVISAISNICKKIGNRGRKDWSKTERR